MTTARQVLHSLDEASPPILRVGDAGIWEDPSPDDLEAVVKDGERSRWVSLSGESGIRALANAETMTLYAASARQLTHHDMVRALNARRPGTIDFTSTLPLVAMKHGGQWAVSWVGRELKQWIEVSPHDWTWVNHYFPGAVEAIESVLT